MSQNNTYGLKSFNYLEDGEVAYNNLDTIKTTNKLDSGVYHLSYLEYPDYRVLVKCDKNTESVKKHSFPDAEKLDNLFQSFFDDKIKERILELGYYHKIGILLHGIEGTGKSTILKRYYVDAINKHEVIVFFVNDYNYLQKCWEFIMDVRAIQDNPFIVIFEELDSIFTKDGKESYLKMAMDGPMSIDNCIYMGTTNYLDRVPAAIKDRPSRFKYKFNIEGIQDETVVSNIITEIIGDLVCADELKVMVKELKGQTVDVIKHKCFDKIMNLNSHDYKKRNKIGFTN